MFRFEYLQIVKIYMYKNNLYLLLRNKQLYLYYINCNLQLIRFVLNIILNNIKVLKFGKLNKFYV